MFFVPGAVRLACWLNAWLQQRVSADDTIAGIVGDDGQAEFSLRPGERSAPALLLADLRRHGISRVSVSLPLPGDLLGLGGPAAFNADAVEAGEAVLLHDAELGLIPHRSSDLTWWRGAPAQIPAFLPDVASAARELRLAITQAAADLAALDLAAWSPEAADALMNLRSPARLDSPLPSSSGPATKLLVDGLRSLEIARLALRDDGGALSVNDVDSRREVLRLLRHCAVAALVASASSLDGI
ncbi:MAG: hypothetical protein ACRDPG_00355 [Nocardioidaceae bacterium]